jgi:hypothetical protein
MNPTCITYRNEQARTNEVQGVTVYKKEWPSCKIYHFKKKKKRSLILYLDAESGRKVFILPHTFIS